MNTCSASTSSLWAWQKEVYHAAERWEHHLFTEEGIKELVAKLQKMADGLKGKDREIRLYKYTHDDSPNIGIGPGTHPVCISFTKVEGTWKEEPQGKKVEVEILDNEGTVAWDTCDMLEAFKRIGAKEGDKVWMVFLPKEDEV